MKPEFFLGSFFALAASAAVAADTPGTITLDCEIESTVKGTDIPWRKQHRTLQVDMEKGEMIERYGDNREWRRPCKITDSLISCESGTGINHSFRRINRYSGDFYFMNSPQDQVIYRNGSCRRVTLEDRKF